jgi:hypothetical protein
MSEKILYVCASVCIIEQIDPCVTLRTKAWRISVVFISKPRASRGDYVFTGLGSNNLPCNALPAKYRDFGAQNWTGIN